jgi:hypothetical protein
MQNKPNLLDAQMNISAFSQMTYENKSDWTLGENKPNSNPIQTQFKPNQSQFAERAKLMQSMYLQRIMKKMRIRVIKKQSQNKPNQTQLKPVLSAVEWANFRGSLIQIFSKKSLFIGLFS